MASKPIGIGRHACANLADRCSSECTDEKPPVACLNLSGKRLPPMQRCSFMPSLFFIQRRLNLLSHVNMLILYFGYANIRITGEWVASSTTGNSDTPVFTSCSTWLASQKMSCPATVSRVSAVVVSFDGMLLKMNCTGGSEITKQDVQILLLDHEVHGKPRTGADLTHLVLQYSNTTQIPVNVTELPPEWWDPVGLAMSNGEGAPPTIENFAAWALDPTVLSGLAVASMLQPLDQLLSLNRGLQAYWQDIPQAFRDAAAVYDGQVFGIPYSAEAPLLFWRRDLFQQQQLSAPSTWEETLALAQKVHGVKVPCLSDNTSTCQMYGFCLGPPDGCFYDGLALTAIWASMVGEYGTKGGLFFDPVDMQPLFNGSAMLEAIRIFRELSRQGPPLRGAPCYRGNTTSYLETCMMGLSLTNRFKTSGLAFARGMRGRLGVSLLPGSHLVQNRRSGLLEPCTKSLCPYATLENNTLTNQMEFVNRVPYLGRGAYSFGLNRRAAPNHALAALRAFTYAITYEDGWPFALDPNTLTMSVRALHLSPGALPRWTAAGYEAGDTAAFLGVVADSMQHPSLAVALRMRGSVDLEAALGRAAADVLYNDSQPDQAVQILEDALNHVLKVHYGGDWTRMQQAYWSDINYSQPPEPAAPEAGSPHKTRSVIAIVSGVVGSVFVLFIVMLLISSGTVCRPRWEFSGTLLHRPVEPPGYSPDTSLCITDIQSSTTLWEALEATVMDTALSLHNGCVRGLLPKHGGYECHTEGDSFIIAFPTAAAAVAFALEMQVALMELPWPDAVLCHEAAAVEYTPVGANTNLTGSPAYHHPLLFISQFFHGHNLPNRQSNDRQRRSEPGGCSGPAPSLRASGRNPSGLSAVSGYSMHSNARAPGGSGGGSGTGGVSIASPPVRQSAPSGGGGVSGPSTGVADITLEPPQPAFFATAASAPLMKASGTGLTRAVNQQPLQLLQAQAHGRQSNGSPRSSASSVLINVVSCAELASGAAGSLPVPRFSNNAATLEAATATAMDDGNGGTAALALAAATEGARDPSATACSTVQWPFPVFRGFRVRCGIASGLVPGRDVLYRKATSRRMAYSGACMRLTKLVSDAAVGGMVLLSSSAVERLMPLPRRDMPGLVVWHKGRFQLDTGTSQEPASDSLADCSCGGEDLYQALATSLAPRQLLLERLPLRTGPQLLPGLLAAPMGSVTLALVQVVGLATLMAWDEDVTRGSLCLLHRTALALLRTSGGYPAAVQDGRVLAAFTNAPSAVRWLLALEEELRCVVDWPPQLLAHELGDELKVIGPQQQPHPHPQSPSAQSPRRSTVLDVAATGSRDTLATTSNTSIYQLSKRDILHSRGLASITNSLRTGVSSRRAAAAAGGTAAAQLSRLHLVSRRRVTPNFMKRSVSDSGGLPAYLQSATELPSSSTRERVPSYNVHAFAIRSRPNVGAIIMRSSRYPGSSPLLGPSGSRSPPSSVTQLNPSPQPQRISQVMPLPVRRPPPLAAAVVPGSSGYNSEAGDPETPACDGNAQSEAQVPGDRHHFASSSAFHEPEPQDIDAAATRPAPLRSLEWPPRAHGAPMPAASAATLRYYPVHGPSTSLKSCSNLRPSSCSNLRPSGTDPAALCTPHGSVLQPGDGSAPAGPAHTDNLRTSHSETWMAYHDRKGLPEHPSCSARSMPAGNIMPPIEALPQPAMPLPPPLPPLGPAPPFPAASAPAPLVLASPKPFSVKSPFMTPPTSFVLPPTPPSPLGLPRIPLQLQKRERANLEVEVGEDEFQDDASPVQRCVLRGLRVRCGAEEGTFFLDGSVNSGQLYGSQHGGRAHSRLVKLCCSALMGQVLCSGRVAKRVRRAAAAGDPLAQQLRVTPLPRSTTGESHKALGSPILTENVSGEAEAFAAAAAAAAVWWKTEASLMEGWVSRRGNSHGDKQAGGHGGKAAVWLCSWAHSREEHLRHM